MGAALAASSLVLFALTACTPEEEIAAKEVDGQIVFKICAVTDGSAIEVYSRDPRTNPVTSVLVWEANATVETEFGAGTEIVYGMAPEGFTSASKAEPIDTRSLDVYFSILSYEDGELADVSGVLIDGGLINSENWTTPAGSQVAEPCS